MRTCASPPLPAAEIDALHAALAGLSSAGRRLDRLARLAGEGGTTPLGLAAGLRDTRRHVDELRRSVGALVGASLRSWEAGDA